VRVNTDISASEPQLWYSWVTYDFVILPYVSRVPWLSGPVQPNARELPEWTFSREISCVREPSTSSCLLPSTSLPLDQTLDTALAMAPSDELEYLKSLVNQLNDKIKTLEEKAKSAVKPKTPAQQLRTILVGPPGSGSSLFRASLIYAHQVTRNLI